MPINEPYDMFARTLTAQEERQNSTNLGASVALECSVSHGIHGLANLTENRIVMAVIKQ